MRDGVAGIVHTHSVAWKADIEIAGLFAQGSCSCGSKSFLKTLSQKHYLHGCGSKKGTAMNLQKVRNPPISCLLVPVLGVNLVKKGYIPQKPPVW